MLIKILIICCLIYLSNASECNKTLHELGDLQGKFLYCVTASSVPVTMCTKCKSLYDEVIRTYDVLAQTCNDSFFDMDRLNLVPFTENMLTGLWTKAYCDDCFNNNNIFTFTNKSQKFYNCLGQNIVDQCNKCKYVYTDLNDFYISLDRNNNGEVCFEIQDSMNRTRYKWSKGLNCCPRLYNILYFSIALGVTTCATFMFYVVTYLVTKRQERNHGILNDEDPLFNSPSSSVPTVAQLNISNNQTQINRRPPPVNADNNIHEDTAQIPENNKVFEAKVENEDSSDDEPLISPSITKEKLK